MLVIIAVTETKFQFLLADKNLQNEGSILQIALFGESDIATLEFCLLLFFCTYYYMMRVEFALKIATLHCSTKICLMRDSMMTTQYAPPGFESSISPLASSAGRVGSLHR